MRAELKQLQDSLNPIEKEIQELRDKRSADVPSREEKKKLQDQISGLRNEKNSLGIFKSKEKKALQAKIDELNSKFSPIEEAIKAEEAEQIKDCNAKIKECEGRANPIKQQIGSVNKRISEINSELTKNR